MFGPRKGFAGINTVWALPPNTRRRCDFEPKACWIGDAGGGDDLTFSKVARCVNTNRGACVCV